MADSRTYIKVHDGMPDHPKVDGLSDRAFRLLVESWCWCSRHLTDGAIPAGTWRKRGTPKARAELAAAGLVAETPDGVVMHDYLEHQRSAEEVREIRAAKAEGGSFGNHVRWHVDRGLVGADCPHCPTPPADDEDAADPIADPSHDRSHMRSGNGSQNGNADPRQGSLTQENFRGIGTAPRRHLEAVNSEDAGNGIAKGIAYAIANGSQNDRKTSPVSVSETEVPGGPVDESSSVVDGWTPDDDLNSKIENQIIAILADLTGRAITPEWARKVRQQILTGRHPNNPLAYVAKALRSAPRNYLQTGAGDPSSRTVAEAIAESMGNQ